ncbi:MAG: hypothetical protein ACAI38_05985 [Myxococcota bacterium]
MQVHVENLSAIELADVHLDGGWEAEIIEGAGTQAARFIMARVEGREAGPPIRDIGFSVVARDSA